MATTRRAYTGGATSTTTTSAIAASGTTSFTITAYTGWPYGTDPFFVVVEPGTASEEKILVTRTGSTDTTINIASDSERGQDGTSAVAHSSGVTVFPVFTALDADEANELTSSWSTKGDLVSYGSSTFETLGVGADDTVLVADSGETSGLNWSSSLDLSGLAVDTDTLYVDATNDRVGVNDSTPSYALDVTGDINASAALRIGGAAIGTYTDYSSSVTFTGFTKGTSTVVAKYARVGKFVHYWGYVITASGFSMTGPLDVSLPFAATGGILTTNSPCSFYDGSTITWGTAINLGGSTIRLVTHAAGGTYAFNADVASNVPFTWLTGDAFYWNHYYEAA